MDTNRCAGAMGCDGEKCMWAASRSSCQEWCAHHASAWAHQITAAIKAAGDHRFPAMLVVDRFSMVGQRGVFVRCVDGKIADVIPKLVEGGLSPEDTSEIVTDHLSRSAIGTMSMSVTACGLAGDPPQHVVDAWNAQYSCVDLIEFAKWMGFSKKSVDVSLYDGNRFLFRNANGEYSQVDEARAVSEMAALLSDRSLKGTRMMFSFNILTSAWDLGDIIRTCEALDAKTPGGACLFRSASGYDGRTFVYEPGVSGCPAGGGVHVSLDCGMFVAQWHTLAHMSASFPIAKDGRVSFRVVMLW